MNKRIVIMLLPIILVFVIPAILLVKTNMRRDKTYDINLATQAIETTLPRATIETQPLKEEEMVSVLTADSEIIEIPLEEYVFHVVLAEMPHWFEVEALKAQAVVARTYTLRRMNGNTKHENADVCVEPSCCQGYLTKEDYLSGGGDEAALHKVKDAVDDTMGLVLVYDGNLIEATYFSCSGGHTEDAAAVWGADVPYLQSTESPGEENATHHTDSVYFSSSDFERIMGRDFSGDPNEWFGRIEYTKGNGVASIDICGQEYSGTKLRSLLGLRSTSFSVSVMGDTILFTTKGFGHRVGMSQYGADAMATAGNTCEEILRHYYKGTELRHFVA